jgi:threonine dehydrogenase-like Zn-dependent dehydrogenase
MRAAIHQAAGTVSVEDVPDPALTEPTDAVVRVVRACVCGSDLWAYRGVIDRPAGSRLGHEFIGVVEEVGSEVSTVRLGDLVVAPFQWSDNTCPACRDGIQTRCDNGGTFGAPGADGGQGEAVRVPEADGTLVAVPGGLAGVDDAMLPALLALTDVAGTGLHGAVLAGVREGSTVAVIGDGAVGLCAVLAARRLGAERILLIGRHKERTDLGREFGATDVIAERGEEGIERVRELTGGDGTRTVLECVGTRQAIEMALGAARDGGVISRVGAAQYTEVPMDFGTFHRNITLTGGVTPARAYIEELMPDIVDGIVEPGRVLDRTISLEETPDGYRAMASREALKVLIRP